MKTKYILATLICSFLLSGCDYLDIVPDERPVVENTYQNVEAARKYLYSCYASIPDPRTSEAVDKFSAAEIINVIEKNDWVTFPRGYYSPNFLSLTKAYYDNIWVGIRQCYSFLSVVDLTPGILPDDLKYFKAEATFLIGYYHFLSLRAYGPTVIIDKIYDPETPLEEYPERAGYDEVCSFIDEKIEESLPNLAESFSGTEYGRITYYAALGLRSRLHLYAASPLFNGNSEYYSDFVSELDGRHLMPQEYSRKKWENAEVVTHKAIEELETAGYRLYNSQDAGTATAAKPGPVDPAQRAVRYTFIDNTQGINPEAVMVDTRKEGTYAIQNQSTPYQAADNGYKSSWNLLAPTLQTVEMFYTENGLPIDEDPKFDYDKRYSIVKMPANYDKNNYATTSNGNTLNLHLNREPRFFTWIGFHNGFFEIAKYNGQATNSNNAKKVMVFRSRKDDENGQLGKTGNYSGTGYLNKKFVHPAFQNGPVHYPYPVIRMAELYLNYAEILIELAESDADPRLTTAKEYIDKIRIRAGIPTVDIAWSKSRHPEKANTVDGLREIVRRERQIEFYLENHRFWDLRRWKCADILGEKVKGMNIYGATDEEFFQVTELPNIRTFNKAQYLLPIPQADTNACPQLVQNPYY